MIDIAPELLEILQNDFREKYNSNEKIKKLNKLLSERKATYQEANQMAHELGEMLANVYQKNLTSDVLPNGQMYENIAKKIIYPTMGNNYDLMATYIEATQTGMNHNARIRIKGIRPELNQSRIDGVINRVSNEADFDKVKWILDEPIKNFTQSIVDDGVKANSEFQYKAGLKPKIIRKEVGNCCDWCKAVVGTYEYPDVQKDVYKRHRYCRCTVEYDPGDGKKVNVHTKNLVDPEKAGKIKERKRIALVKHSSSINIVMKVRSGEINLKYNKDHYDKHIEGSKQFDQYYNTRKQKGFGKQGVLTIDYFDAQQLIYDFHGRGIVPSTASGQPRKQEDINFGKYIGHYVYNNKEYLTTKGRIYYGKKGSHIVPIKGDHFD